jgi:hypothetical protein
MDCAFLFAAIFRVAIVAALVSALISLKLAVRDDKVTDAIACAAVILVDLAILAIV